MQYFKPAGDFFVGDCMPFYHEGVFHLYYLLDEGHHQGKGGLGGHQWAHASTRDLVHWEHHPLALAIEHEWEASICTGSVFFHDGVFYAFYATRLPDRTEHLSVATSTDGIRFTKASPNPFASPEPPYRKGPYRDPCVFRDPQTGRFHMLVTAELADYPLAGRGGCLAHLTSADLRDWRHEGPFLVPGNIGHQPECADYFEWRGFYYLIFSHLGVARYRFSRGPFGPWLRPNQDIFDGPKAAVLKTAAFTGDRRLGVAFLTSEPPHAYAGNAVFREIVQHGDGSLGTKFPAEMTLTGGETVPLRVTPLTEGLTWDDGRLDVSAQAGMAVAALEGLPHDLRLTVQVRPEPGTGNFELGFRGSGSYQDGLVLRFEPARGRVGWLRPGSAGVSAFRQGDAQEQERAAIYEVEGLDRPFELAVIARGDIIDVCVDRRRTLVNRVPDVRGDRLFIGCQDGRVTFDAIEIRS